MTNHRESEVLLVPSTPLLSVSIASFNSQHDLVALIRLLRQGGTEWMEILIHENGDSASPPLEWVQPLPGLANVRYATTGRNLGFGGAHNANLAAASGEWFLVLNPDIEARPEDLQRLVAAAENAGSVCTAPLLRLPDGSIQQSVRDLPTLRYELYSACLLDRLSRNCFSIVRPAPRPGRSEFVPQAAGAALLLRTATMLQLGGFDERFFVYFEDVDLCARLGAFGGVFVDGSVEFMHTAEGTARNYRWQTTALIELSRQIYYAKHATPTIRSAVAVLTVVRCAIRALLLVAEGLVKRKQAPLSRARGYLFAATYCAMPQSGVEKVRAVLNG